MISTRMLILPYTIQQVIHNVCTKFPNAVVPAKSLTEKKFTHTRTTIVTKTRTHTHTHTHTRTNGNDKQEAHGPQFAHMIKMAIAYLPCNILPVLPQQLDTHLTKPQKAQRSPWSHYFLEDLEHFQI